MRIDRTVRRLRPPVRVRRFAPRLPRVRVPRRGALAYLAMMGPGLITASAGNDAGGIATYAQAGAAYGYKLLWAMVITAVSLIVVQEMCARMGAVTGKGLSDLIREEFGIGWATLAMVGLLVANGAITISEFVGINAATRVVAGERALRGTAVGALLPYLVVALSAIGLWWLVTKGSRGPVERVLLVMTLVFFAYIPAALKGERDWGAVAHAVVTPTLGGPKDIGLIAFLIALVGTTISPYMQFFVQSSVVEQGATMSTYRQTRDSVVIGSLFAILVAMFIIVATAAALYGKVDPANLSDAGAYAGALEPVLGSWAKILFAVGLFGASLLAAAVLPLSTAFAVCEVFGFESGVDKTFQEAPVFNGIFTGLIALAVLVSLAVPAQALVLVLVQLQAINGIVLTMVLVFVLRLVNNRRLMGRHTNNALFNAIAWASTAVLAVLSALYIPGVLFHLGPAAG
jgi:NRAMP (natural resistance-associated macrophage protein)-like metal ion transporter